MLITTDYRRGDIALVNFAFSEATGSKRRPVLLLSSDKYKCMEGHQEAVVSAITSNTRRIPTGDYLMVDWEDSSLIFPSVATDILRTIKQSMIERKIRDISQCGLAGIESNLTHILELNN